MIGAPSNGIPHWSPTTAAVAFRHHHEISLPPTLNNAHHLALATLQRYVPRGGSGDNSSGACGGSEPFLDGYWSDEVVEEEVEEDEEEEDDDDEEEEDEGMTLVDALTCDEFRMYEFKVRQCARGRSHDWTQCPYAHPGEKARRRDPRKYHYSGSPCPEFRKGTCRKGDSCEFAHGVFECWLHPSRYRTQPCKDGVGCRRRVCFFAHVPEELRVLPTLAGYDASPVRKTRATATAAAAAAAAAAVAGGGGLALSPTSNLVGPVSPSGSSGVGSPPASPTLGEVMLEMRFLQLWKRTREAGMGWDWRHRQLRHTTRAFDGWRSERPPENAGTAAVESSVDEPAWFSDIVN